MEELLELFMGAKKAADAASGNDVSSSAPEVLRCLDALKLLSNYPVSYDVLCSSQVGKQLRSLTRHPQREIQSAASKLLEKWKRIVIDETRARKKNGCLELESKSCEKVKEAAAGSRRAVEDSAASNSKASSSPPQAQPPRPPQPTPPGDDAAPPRLTKMLKCNDPTRDKVRELLAEALAKVRGESEAASREVMDEVNACDPIRVAVSVESAMFQKLGRSNGTQKVKYRSIMFNMKDPNNPDLRRKVLVGAVKPERLIRMTAEEMASEKRQQENDEIKAKALFECERSDAMEATTAEFQCKRCFQRKCTYYQLQTRSADEPMTTFVTCTNCNNHWKFC